MRFIYKERHMYDYEKLKLKNDIISVAYELKYNGTRSGSCLQGDCPKHGSTNRKCLVLWPLIGGWKCYHCNSRGDVIGLVRHFKNCDFRTAVNYLADRVKMPHLGQSKLSKEEQAQYIKDQAEKN